LTTYRKVLTRGQIDSIKKGEKPTGEDKLDDRSELAFDAAIALATGKGNLLDGMFNKLVPAFDKTGALVLINYVGVYAYTCILLNGAAMPIPFSE
jgi:4-carboxymuconolactone decarboxylase